jgi:tRNA threonylcarbamoyladenosine biosynthesis protein TsaE
MNDKVVRRKNRARAPEISTSSEEETFRLARDLAKSLRGNEVIFLIGELGAGKTVFAKGLAAGLGFKDSHLVCSPTYTLLNIYQAKCPIYHFDLYRLDKEADIKDLGWEDYLDNGVLIVEWAEKLDLDIPVIRVRIKAGKGNRRKIAIER